MQGWFNVKNHMIILIDVEIAKPLMVGTFSRLGVEGSNVNLIQSIYKKSTVNSTLNCERPNALSLRQYHL